MNDYEERAEALLERLNTSLTVRFVEHGRHFYDDTDTRDIYECTLTRGNRTYTFRFGQSIANRGVEPTAYDIIACLTKHDPGTFEEYCSDFGCDLDSYTARAVHQDLRAEYIGMTRLFSDDELALLAEIA